MAHFSRTNRRKKRLRKLLITPNWTVNPQCVGQAPTKIARMAGFEVPPNTSIICVEVCGVGKEHPLSAEKLSPVLSLYFVADFAAALETCHALLRFGGTGHTAVIHAKNDARIREYGLRMPAMRVLVNTPSPQGSTGITTNVFPAMTLGCGAVAGNATSDNIGPQHLFNIKRLAYAVRKPEEAFEMPIDIDAAPTASAFACAAPVDRATVVAAVERYLAARGFTPGAANMAAPVVGSVSNVAAEVVDRFLAKKTSPERCRPAATVDWNHAAPPETAPAPSVTPPPQTVDFVCEADVRAAISEGRKIFIRLEEHRHAFRPRCRCAL